MNVESANVHSRSVSAPLPCYLVEWFAPAAREMTIDHAVAVLQRCAASMSIAGPQVRLIDLLAVPTDEYVLAVFTANSAEDVVQTCHHAGLPAQRLTAALAPARPPASGPA